jgi:hypothetical protein
MESRPRIAYKDKYLFWRNAAVILAVAFVISLVFMVRAAKANLETQAMLISPDGVRAHIEVIK